MMCPFCRQDETKVIDSRASQEDFVIRRRRECLSCKRRYTTFERIEDLSIKVIKKNGVRVAFEREKIKYGLARACWKRPISDEQIDTVVARIQAAIAAEADKEISSANLGELIMNELRDLDQVAYVRFASVYREFKDARDFVTEVQPMLDENE